MNQRQAVLITVGSIVGAAAWFGLLDEIVFGLLPSMPKPISAAVAFGPPALLFVFAAWLQWASPNVVRERRRRLRELGHDLCAHCGYDLAGRDANAGECPECGRNLSEMPPAPDTDREAGPDCGV
ncbi:MAG: hypothetical protein AAF138_09055 [Planctomycetota bacterium]